MCLPVHDDPVWDINALYVLVVVLRVGEQVQTVPGPVVFYLHVRSVMLNIAQGTDKHNKVVFKHGKGSRISMIWNFTGKKVVKILVTQKVSLNSFMCYQVE